MSLMNLVQFFEETVRIYPQETAIIENDVLCSFSTLHERVLNVAYTINKTLEGKTKQVIAVLIPKSIDSITADIAITYSANAYMNVDIKNPVQRIQSIYNTIKPSLAIANKNTPQEVLAVFSDIPVLFLESLNELPSLLTNEKKSISQIAEKTLTTDLLCIINTSGSTGVPKGVAMPQIGFMDYIQSVVHAELVGKREIMASLSPAIFDHHSYEVTSIMMLGSTLLLIPDQLASFPLRMLELMQKYKATYLFWVPTIMVNIANMDLLSQIALPDLSTIWFAGEVFPTAKCNYWRKYLPTAKFVNLYGPTEIFVDCTYFVMSRELEDKEPIPIGIALPNTEILLLKDGNTLAQNSEDGEICVLGCGLAYGYYNNPEKTSEVFVQNPLNSSYPEIIYRTGDIGAYNEYGEILFKGRKDSLIKHSGYRIELGEIENTIIGSKINIQNCCALYSLEDKKIILVYETTEEILEKELRKQLNRILPRYMVPTAFVCMKELPRNVNGKIDRLKLKNQFAPN